MQNKNQIDPELLNKYLEGKCSEEETKFVENWYNSIQGNKDYLSALSALDRSVLEAETLDNIHQRLDLTVHGERQVFRFNKSLAWSLGIAASVLLVLGILWIYNPERQLGDTLLSKVSGENVKMIRFVNTQTQLFQYHLPDGTKVWLHPQAAIEYPEAFEANERKVSFKGEGFFEVFRDAKRPFYIKSDNMLIRVLGTSFNVKAKPNQSIFNVSVVTGSVSVKGIKDDSKNLGVILKPREEVFYDIKSNRLTVSRIAEKPQREIYEPVSIQFNETPVKEVLEQLEKKFNVKIEVFNQAVFKCRLTADFNNQSLPVILELLCTSLDATYTFSEGTLILEGAGCD
ncbi:ferric-dicitrate binding protein FerR, regulates iron transport through sigma-19 [Pseudarcicella hirudinis]|uniref:Ferric-dicitrate binding protein FerR, regulates iron transport through sigma-19 n=1 Tax=Pseudarcicella hirudinis TaxID=1079859 RepID=A0A1I5LZ74_9BACT|nr:FecR family protein [Pseudarcicella hirudinis]SFP02668.1 ferric-dicitrate binding protein FerR, regulates iron transport through sigma-19 [Pseudarcicella hirudinis]